MNENCFILAGYIRKADSSVYTTTLIRNLGERTSFGCGEWETGVTTISRRKTVF